MQKIAYHLLPLEIYTAAFAEAHCRKMSNSAQTAMICLLAIFLSCIFIMKWNCTILHLIFCFSINTNFCKSLHLYQFIYSMARTNGMSSLTKKKMNLGNSCIKHIIALYNSTVNQESLYPRWRGRSCVRGSARWRFYTPCTKFTSTLNK